MAVRQVARRAEPVVPRLPLALHGQFTRAEVYGAFGINYDARATRHLNVGLSPVMPDDGYLIFVTLDKSTIDEDYDYEVILFRDRLVWVTRSDRGEDDPEYVMIRRPGTRVSLFARRKDKERFVYLGELRWQDHEEFSNEARVQQRYVFRLWTPVPGHLLAELTGDADSVDPGPTEPRAARRTAARTGPAGPRTRRPETLDEYQRAFRYAVGQLERQVVPAHQHYQMRLRAHFEARGTSPNGSATSST